MTTFLIALIVGYFGYVVGKEEGKFNAYRELQQECKKLGRFYIEDEVFYVKTKDSEENS